MILHLVPYDEPTANARTRKATCGKWINAKEDAFTTRADVTCPACLRIQALTDALDLGADDPASTHPY